MKKICIAVFCLGTTWLMGQTVQKIKIRKNYGPEQKCSGTLLGKPGGKIKASELALCHNIQVSGPCNYKVVSFILSYAIRGVLKEYVCDSVFDKDALMFVGPLRPGNTFFIENIKAQSNVTGQVFSLPNLKFKVVN